MGQNLRELGMCWKEENLHEDAKICEVAEVDEKVLPQHSAVVLELDDKQQRDDKQVPQPEEPGVL